MERYGVSVHHAAALVIGRRAMGLKEQISKELKHKISAKIAKFKEKLDQEPKTSPEEGKGVRRKTERFFKQLDEKLLVYNGLTRFKQEAFKSVWSDLKKLA